MLRQWFCPAGHLATGSLSPAHCPVCGLPVAEATSLSRLADPAEDHTRIGHSPRPHNQPPQAATLSPGDTPAPFLVPGYEILGVLGRGGMGVVYKARQVSLNRIVALKVVLHGGHASPTDLLRFRIEAEAVAQLQHPNIVAIHEISERGARPFFSLEYLEGGTLAQRLDGTPIPPRVAAALVERLARAVDYAHRRGIVHRDLKPANILLAEAPGTPLEACTPKIADFGLAKRLDEQGHTGTEAILGTPAYMAPEQAGHAREVGPACDIYALGAILYDLLTGRPPFQGATMLDTLAMVRQSEPVAPSRLQPRCPADLQTICLKCLQKEPAQRYASAEALADDLARFLAGEPIRARPASTLERAVKWARRKPALAGLLLAVLAALLAGSAVSTYFGFDAHQRAREARDLAGQREAALAQTRRALADADLQRAELKFRAALEECQSGAVQKGLFTLLEAWRESPPEAGDFRRVVRANIAAWGRQLPVLQHVLRPAAGRGNGLTLRGRFLGPDGDTFATWVAVGNTAVIERWDTLSGAPLGQPIRIHGAGPCDLSPDGTLLCATGVGPGQKGDRGFVYRLAEGPSILAEVRHRDARGQPCYTEPFFTASSGVLMLRADDFSLRWGFRRFWSTQLPGELPISVQLAPGEGLHLTRDRAGRDVLVVFRQPGGASDAPHAEFWDAATGKRLAALEAPTASPDPRLAWDGRSILSISGDRSFPTSSRGCDGSVRWFDTATGRQVGGTWKPRRQASYSELAADGQALAALGRDQRIRLFDLGTGWQRGGDVPGVARSLNQAPHCLAVSPSGSHVLVGSRDGTVRIWRLQGLALQATAAAVERVGPAAARPRARSAVLGPDGRTVLVAGASTGTWLDAASSQPRGQPIRHPHLAFPTFSPDGRRLATATNPDMGSSPTGSPLVRIWSADTGRPLTPFFLNPKFIHGLAFSPDGQLLAVAGVGGVLLLDADRLAPRRFLPEDTCAAGALFSPDGRRLAVLYKSGWTALGAGFRLWDLVSGKPLGPMVQTKMPDGYRDFVAAFGEEGRVLRVLDCYNGNLHTLDTATGQPRGPVRFLGATARAAFDAPHRARLATSDSSGRLRLWDAATGQPLEPAMTSAGLVRSLHFSPDGTILAASCQDGAVRLWDVATRLPLGPPLLHRGELASLAFSPAGRSLVTVTETGAATTWPLPGLPADDPDQVEAWLQATGGVELRGSGVVLLEADLWARKKQQQAEQPRSLSVTAWHDLRARAAEEDGDTFATLWHLDALIERRAARRPGRWLQHARRGRALARAGSLDRAAADYRQAERLAGREGRSALRDWYHQQSALSLERRDEQAAWYFDRFLQAGGDDLSTYLALLERLAGQGKRRELARLVETMGRSVPSGVLYIHALLHVQGQDGPAYRRLCARLLGRLRPPHTLAEAQEVNTAVMACALAPDAVADWHQPLALLAGALAVLQQQKEALPPPLYQATRHAWLNTWGAALHRAGRHRQAIARLHQAIHAGGAAVAEDWLFLALAHARLGERAAASRCLDRVRGAHLAGPEKGFWSALEFDLLSNEASRLLDAGVASPGK